MQILKTHNLLWNISIISFSFTCTLLTFTIGYGKEIRFLKVISVTIGKSCEKIVMRKRDEALFFE